MASSPKRTRTQDDITLSEHSIERTEVCHAALNIDDIIGLIFRWLACDLGSIPAFRLVNRRWARIALPFINTIFYSFCRPPPIGLLGVFPHVREFRVRIAPMETMEQHWNDFLDVYDQLEISALVSEPRRHFVTRILNRPARNSISIEPLRLQTTCPVWMEYEMARCNLTMIKTIPRTHQGEWTLYKADIKPMYDIWESSYRCISYKARDFIPGLSFIVTDFHVPRIIRHDGIRPKEFKFVLCNLQALSDGKKFGYFQFNNTCVVYADIDVSSVVPVGTKVLPGAKERWAKIRDTMELWHCDDEILPKISYRRP